MRTMGDDIEARLGPDVEVPGGDLNKIELSGVPLFKPTLAITRRGSHIDTHTPWPLRQRIFTEYFQHDRERRARIDGIALSKVITKFWLSCKLIDMNAFEMGGTVCGWPSFLHEVAVDGRVFRKWCKNEASVQAVLNRGLVAAHSSCSFTDASTGQLMHYPFLEGTFLANPEDAPNLSDHHRFQHYVDFTLPAEAGVVWLNKHKYVLPGIARVLKEDVRSALTTYPYLETPDEFDPPIIGCARMFGDQLPVPYTPVYVVGTSLDAAGSAIAAGGAMCMSPLVGR